MKIQVISEILFSNYKKAKRIRVTPEILFSYFKNNYNAKFFLDQNEVDLKNKILFFIKNPKKLILFRKNLMKKFEETMSIQNYEKKFEKILQKSK